MLDILFITPAGPEWASSRMRAYWPAEYMDNASVLTVEQLAHALPRARAYVFIKQAFTRHYQLQVRHAIEDGRQVWWDMCDPLHWTQPAQTRAALEHVTGVVCSNGGLAQDFARWCENTVPVHTIEDRLYLPHYNQQREHRDTRPVRLIWYGIAANRMALFAAQLAIARYIATYGAGSLELTIMDDQPENNWSHLFDCPVYHVRWSLANEVSIIANHDAALLPPYPGPWGCMKSDNKRMTAHACGLPVVTGIDWRRFERMRDWQERAEAGRAGRDYVEQYRDVQKSAEEWQCLINRS